MVPLYDTLLDAMARGTAEQATFAASLFSEQVGAWGAFAQSIAEAIDVKAMLPDDFAARFDAGMQDEYKAILKSLVEGNATLAALQLEQFNKQVAAWKAIGVLVNTIHVEVAQATGSVAAMVHAWEMQRAQMDRTIARASAAFTSALSSGDVEAIASTAAALHDATMARYQAERQAVEQLLAAEQQLLTSTKELADTVTRIAVTALAMGDASRINALLASLADLAASGPTVSVKLFAIGAGIRAIVAALPEAVKGAGVLAPDAAVGVFSQIPATIASAATPFLSSLDGMIADALTAGDTQGALDLLKAQAGAIQDLGAAAISAVEQWRDQTIAAYEKIAGEMIAAIEKERDTKIRAIEAQRDADLAANEIALNAIQAQIQVYERLLSAVQGAESFVQGLLLGPGSPLNPAEQLALVKDQYAAAKAVALSSPEGLSGAVQAGQTYLSFLGRGGENSAALKIATAEVLKDLQGWLGSTGSSATLRAQIGGLQAQAATLTDTNRTIREAADKQIAEIRALADGRILEIRDKLADAIEEIRTAATDTIKGINEGVATALDVNTTRQTTLLSELFNSNQDQLKAITGGIPVQYFLADRAKATVAALESINGQLALFLLAAAPPAAPTPPAPASTPVPERAVGSFAMGTPFVPRTGWAYVHRGERITPAAQNTGFQVLVIEELRVVTHLDGKEIGETVLRHIPVKVRAGGRGFIPADAVAKR